MKRIIYVAGNGKKCHGYSNWLKPDKLTNDINEANIVLGLGGSDVSPHYYNQPNSGLLSCDSQTDLKEFLDFKKAIKLGKKIIGICKSSQWAAALNGGSIFQHISHPSYHTIKTFDGLELLTNSLHHNMQNVLNLKENEDYKLLGWAENLSPCHIDGYNNNITCTKEPEVVFYPKTNWLAFQNHNEMIFNDLEFQPMLKWSSGLVDKFLNNKL